MLTIFIKSETNNEAAKKKLAKRKSYDKYPQVSDTNSVSEFLCNDKFFFLLHRPPSQSPVWHRTVPTANCTVHPCAHCALKFLKKGK